MKTYISTRQQFLCFLLFAFVAVGVAFCYGIHELPLLGDNQHYFYISERVASSFPPHKSYFDIENSLTTLLSGMAIYVGRVVGISDLISARILSVSIFAASIGLIWLLSYHLTKSLRTSAFAALSMLSFPAYIIHSAQGCRSKVFIILFMLLTILLFCRRKPFWAGLCASLSFLCWQPSLLMLGILVIVLALYPKRFHNIGLAVLGAILPILVYEAYFIFTSSLWEQLKQAYYFPARFKLHPFGGYMKLFLELKRIWIAGFGRFNILPIIFAYGLIRYWIRVFRSTQSISSFVKKEAGWLYFHLCMYGTLAFTYYDHQWCPDIFFVLPFTAIMSGWTLDRSIEDISVILRRKFNYIASGFCLFFLLALIIIGPAKTKFPYTLSDQYRLAATVGQFLEDNESVYAIGCAHLLAFNHAENWMKYGSFFGYYDDFIAHKMGTDIFRPVKNDTWPSIILLSRRRPLGSRQWLAARYTDITPPEFKYQRIKVFKLKEEFGRD